MGRFRSLGILLVALAVTFASPAFARDFYVSPDGDDSNPGTRSKPFATLKKARDAVRSAPQKGDERITVHLRDGTYVLGEPLVFTPDDSGSADAPVVYTAASGEQAIVSGGQAITDWEETEYKGQRCWQTKLQSVADGDWYFRQLFVNGQRRSRPRVPEEGYHRFAGATESARNWRGKPESAKFKPGDLKAWENLQHVEMVILNRWVDGHDRLAKVDEEKNIVHFKPRAYQNIRDSKGKWARYYVNNVMEALDSPGEWYLERSSGILRYFPYPGEKPDSSVAYAPRFKTVIRLEGTGDSPVSHIRFQNISFRHAEPEVEQNPRQSASTVPGSVTLEHARDCVFYGCDFAHMGGYALEIKGGCDGNHAVACTFRDMGAGGVRLNNGSRATEVADCNIRAGSRIWNSASGILIQDSGWNRIMHNDIHDFHYSGIACGWTWGYQNAQTVDNRICHNHIHNLGQGVLSDMGGIYLLGTHAGGVLRGNFIHDVESYSYGGWGLYTDQGSSFVLMEDNIAIRTTKGGFHQHYGRGNVLRNNILGLSRDYEIKHSRPQHVRSFTFTNNIVYAASEADMMHGRWDRMDYVLKNNLWWCESDRPPLFDGQTLEEWRQGERGKGAIAAAPLFADPHGNDFTLRSDSPASQIDFEPIDMSSVGPRLSGSRPASYDDWPKAEYPDKIVLEPRLETMKTHKNASPQEPYFQPFDIKPGEPCEVYYRLRNRGKLPADGSLHIAVDEGGELRGKSRLSYDLKPGETMETSFKVVLKKDAPRLMVEVTGDDVATTALYLTAAGK